MKIIVRPRRAGKTYDLIKQAAEENLYIICPNRSQVHDIADQARKMELVIPFPLTWQEFIQQQYYGKHIEGFVIDNLDICIQSMSPVEIKAVSLNGGAS